MAADGSRPHVHQYLAASDGAGDWMGDCVHMDDRASLHRSVAYQTVFCAVVWTAIKGHRKGPVPAHALISSGALDAFDGHGRGSETSDNVKWGA